MNPKQRFKVYSRLLSLYPTSYRKHYGEQLLQTIADMVDDAPSAPEKFNVWLRISLDFPITVCREHIQVIGDRMNAKKQYNVGRNTLVSTGLFLLPIIILTVNRMLMISGPGRNIPSYYLAIASNSFPTLAIVLAGFTLYRLLRGHKATRPTLRQVAPLVVVCLLSLLFLAWAISEDIRYYSLTH
jgi:hypothetical protein